jgi:two-component system response regulator DesR
VISVMIVGEVDLVRGALAARLRHEDDLEITSELPLRDDTVVTAINDRPAVVIIDIDRYGAGGLTVARRLAAELPACRVLLLTDRQTPPVLRRALALGAFGLVSPEMSPEQLAQAIRQAVAGERIIDMGLAAAALADAFPRPARRPRQDNPLTAHERAALRLAGEGLRSREIAERLYLSPGTVRNYLSHAIRKTGARNRLEAIRRAQNAGWL